MNTRLYKIKAIGLLLSGMFLISGCTDNFDEINTNPDKPMVATSAWLATDMITTVTSKTAMRTTGFKQPYNLAKYVLWTELQADLQYNILGRSNFTDKLTTLRNVEPMIGYATTPELKNSYTALGHFLRAWQFFQLSMRVGDIPYSEAIQGNKGIIKPKYDTQKDVFLGILDELDKANTLFSQGTDISGDFIYKGSVDKWRRLVNSFELYVLMNLYKKTDMGFDVAAKFKEVSQRPLMRDYNDNFAIVYNGSKSYCYPWSNTQTDLNEFTQYTMLSTTFINMLKENNDRRLFYVAEPADSLLNKGKLASNFDAYMGVEPSDEFVRTLDRKAAGAYSDLNKRYVLSATAEPVGLLCHWDVQFLLAEAAVRGWITDASYYENGIRSSLKFYANYANSIYTHGVTIDNNYIDTYPATVPLTGSTENKIKQIICQKYLAGFFQNEYQAWFEFRRTGYPAFVLNPKTNSNVTDNKKFPIRWQYPQNEIDYNTDNVNAAIQSQYGGSDDFNQVMWLLK